MNVNLVTDYHPWTAVLYNGSRISRLTNPHLSFKAVLARLEDVHLFVIHLEADLHAGVRLSDGFFYFGPDAINSHNGWFPSVNAPRNPTRFELVYSRSCRATMGVGPVRAKLLHYNLGWKHEGVHQLMLVHPDGTFEWSK